MFRRAVAFVLALAIWSVVAPQADALIRGDKGNSPIDDPGWPKGAEQIFNHRARVAWWEGPPFGGGQWHAECRGDADVFNDILVAFGKLDAKTKRLVVHDGVGHSFWLNPNNEPEKELEARIDWQFMVWDPRGWGVQQRLGPEHSAIDPRDAESGPPSQIDVFTGGNIKWADVVVPDGITVIDERLEANGYSLDDGRVIEGEVTDLETNEPIAATVQLELIEPQPTGGYKYTVKQEARADGDGQWAMTKIPPGWYRVVASSDNHIPRIIAHVKFDEQPSWDSYVTGLAKAAEVAGRVTFEGKPLQDVQVRLSGVASSDKGRYETTADYNTTTDEDGRFRLRAPSGQASIWVHKSGYCRPGLGPKIEIPSSDVELEMVRSSEVRISVDFGDAQRATDYIVHMEPEKGPAVGLWSGSASLNEFNQVTYKDVPPGRYVIYGMPNPGSANERTANHTVELMGGETLEVSLKAVGK